jgi:hypothetical protein
MEVLPGTLYKGDIMPKVIDLPVPEQKSLLILDNEGEVWVRIRQPSVEEESRRSRALRYDLIYDGVRPNFSITSLNTLELWLTYEDSNIDVVIRRGKNETPIKFKPREQMTEAEFMAEINKLPPNVFIEWVDRMHEVVPEWDLPFRTINVT